MKINDEIIKDVNFDMVDWHVDDDEDMDFVEDDNLNEADDALFDDNVSDV